MIETLFPFAGPITFGWRDALDILLMAVLIYQVGLLIRGTRALQALVGVLVVIVAYWATGPGQPLRLATFHQVLGNILFYAPFAVIVLFQSQIRQALTRVGRNPIRAPIRTSRYASSRGRSVKSRKSRPIDTTQGKACARRGKASASRRAFPRPAPPPR